MTRGHHITAWRHINEPIDGSGEGADTTYGTPTGLDCTRTGDDVRQRDQRWECVDGALEAGLPFPWPHSAEDNGAEFVVAERLVDDLIPVVPDTRP